MTDVFECCCVTGNGSLNCARRSLMLVFVCYWLIFPANILAICVFSGIFVHSLLYDWSNIWKASVMLVCCKNARSVRKFGLQNKISKYKCMNGLMITQNVTHYFEKTNTFSVSRLFFVSLILIRTWYLWLPLTCLFLS